MVSLKCWYQHYSQSNYVHFSRKYKFWIIIRLIFFHIYFPHLFGLFKMSPNYLCLNATLIHNFYFYYLYLRRNVYVVHVPSKLCWVLFSENWCNLWFWANWEVCTYHTSYTRTRIHITRLKCVNKSWIIKFFSTLNIFVDL